VQTVIISRNNIKLLVFIVWVESVCCEVRTENLNISRIKFVLHRLCSGSGG